MLAADLVSAWEQGQSRSPAHRWQPLLAVLGVDVGRRTQLSVGQRDALLLDLRGELFGSSIVAVASCPDCAERVELGFEVDDVRTRPPGDPTATFELTSAGYTVLARPPAAGDLAELGTARSGADARELLMARCVTAARRGDADVPVTELPDGVRAELVARMAAADPQADTRLVLTCPSCACTWAATFDIVSFLWQELDAWVHSLIDDVHRLASAYGWSEAEIFAMSPSRRSLYLGLVRR
ncbi:hypothetical protein FHU33_2302 [Blastococcus colisei]|uniref:Phage baseplate protein n=1 Tax=Blastococcus colisei TaxID=1564162 RepID=A0A543PFN5_9ACTN|nr:phage baseplate protein [Blastococcus colisei]TQN42891.1 hypothetical protein FHU33_2302 [Blastococcus colisei]